MRIVIVCILALGNLNFMQVRKVIKKHVPEFGACFEKHGDVNATVDVDFVIKKSGDTEKVTASGEGNAGLRGCLAGVFKRMQFPASSSETKVHYPVHIIVAGG